MYRYFFLLITILLFNSAVKANEIDSFLQSRSVLAQIYFEKNSWQLSLKSQEALRGKVPALVAAQRAGQLIRVEGFASTEGQAEINYNISLRRAGEVRYFLQQFGLASEFFLNGHGEKNISTVRLSEQRRVDIAVYQPNPTVKQLFQESGTIERFDMR